MIVRFRIPFVLIMFIQDCFELSISILIVERICAISAFTRTESSSPSAWYLTKIAWASSYRSLLTSHLGLSGTKLGATLVAISKNCDEDSQNEDNLQNGGAHLQQRWNSPTPVTREAGGSESDGCCCDRTNEIGRVEQRCQSISILRMAKFSNQGRAGNDAENDAKTKDHTGKQVHPNFEK